MQKCLNEGIHSSPVTSSPNIFAISASWVRLTGDDSCFKEMTKQLEPLAKKPVTLHVDQIFPIGDEIIWQIIPKLWTITNHDLKGPFRNKTFPVLGKSAT